MPAKSTARLTAQSSLMPALQTWESYLYDQGRTPNTVKAFLSDVRLLTRYLPADQAVGSVTTRDLDRFFRWMEKERGVPCSPKTLARRITAT
jgi:integrase/recombinase XerD